MAKKIGILTFHNAINYGAVFQAFALQTFIEQQTGDQVKIIDLTTDDHLKGLNPISLASNSKIKNLVLKSWNLLFYFKLKRRNNKFIKFKDEKLHLTAHRFKNSADIEKNEEKFDIFISGSDQVFHPKIKNAEAYYLAFNCEGIKRIAYAPSFGISEISHEDAKRIAPWLDNFNYLSCREERGAEIISYLTGKDVPIVCDPVFLPDDKFWMSLADSERPIKEKYIFMFDLNGGQNLAYLARQVAKETGLLIICASFNILSRYDKIKKLYDLGPLDWLRWMRHAEYIVTDSFHGSAIGLKLNRKVLSYVAMPSTASRLETLFKELGIQDQLISRHTIFSFSDVRFADYHDKMDSFSYKSKKYLLDAINY